MSDFSTYSLTHLGLIEASGIDAAHFLHAQLTQQVEDLPESAWRWAALCEPKGRMLASFLLVKNAETIFLQCAEDVVVPTLERLKKYVMRSKVTLTNITGSWQRFGIQGDTADIQKHLRFFINAWPIANELFYETDLIFISRTSNRYELWIHNTHAKFAELTALLNQHKANTADWILAEIQAGIPWITAATSGEIVPQQANFELIGGVNFKKGCYPGQEIVARMQYRGKPNRRLFRLNYLDHEKIIQPGSAVFSETKPNSSCGMIINTVNFPDGHAEAVAVLHLDFVGSVLHGGEGNGPTLEVKNLKETS